MVSNEEGERIRAETDARKAALLRTLEGAKITELIFGGIGISAMRLDGFILEKDGKQFRVTVEGTIEGTTYYSSLITWIEVTDVEENKTLTESED
jgi:hypothetical protein